MSTGWLECDPGPLFKPEYFAVPQWFPEWVRTCHLIFLLSAGLTFTCLENSSYIVIWTLLFILDSVLPLFYEETYVPDKGHNKVMPEACLILSGGKIVIPRIS